MGKKVMEYPVCSGEMFILSIMLFVSVATVTFGYVQGCVGGSAEVTYLRADITAPAGGYGAEQFYVNDESAWVTVSPEDPDMGIVYILSESEWWAFQMNGNYSMLMDTKDQDIGAAKTGGANYQTLTQGTYWAVVDNLVGTEQLTVGVHVYTPGANYKDEATGCGPDPEPEPYSAHQEPFYATPSLPGGMALLGIALGAMLVVKLK